MRLVRRRLRAVIAPVIALAAGLSVACSLLTSVDGLSGGGSLADGGPPDVAAAAPEGGDATMQDASTSADADASWCTTHRGDAAFCDDFDTLGLTRWNTTIERGGGTVKVDTASASSPPSSMVADLPALVDGGMTGAFVVRSVPVPAVELSADAELRVDKVSAGTTQLQLMKLVQQNPNVQGAENAWEVGVAVNPTTRKLAVFRYNYYSGDYANVYQHPTAVELGAWTRVSLHVRVRGLLDGVIDIDINGTRVGTDLPVLPVFAKAPFLFYAGAVYTDPTHDGWTVRADNVVFDSR